MRLGSPLQSSPDDIVAPRPAPVGPPPLDRTTLVVRLGLVALAITGVLTIFGDTLFGLGVSKEVTSGAMTPPMPDQAAPSTRP
jgi:hypothetical protein